MLKLINLLLLKEKSENSDEEYFDVKKSDEKQRLKNAPFPLRLHDVANYLRKRDSPEHIENAFSQLPKLLGSVLCLEELTEGLAGEIANGLIIISDDFETPLFSEVREKSVLRLLDLHSKVVLKLLTLRFCSDCSISVIFNLLLFFDPFLIIF